jgi:hypothetical protein
MSHKPPAGPYDLSHQDNYDNEQQKIKNPYEEFEERKIKTNSNLNYDYLNGEYPDEQQPYNSNVTTLPSLDKPKFQPTKATQ